MIQKNHIDNLSVITETYTTEEITIYLFTLLRLYHLNCTIDLTIKNIRII